MLPIRLGHAQRECWVYRSERRSHAARCHAASIISWFGGIVWRRIKAAGKGLHCSRRPTKVSIIRNRYDVTGLQYARVVDALHSWGPFCRRSHPATSTSGLSLLSTAHAPVDASSAADDKWTKNPWLGHAVTLTKLKKPILYQPFFCTESNDKCLGKVGVQPHYKIICDNVTSWKTKRLIYYIPMQAARYFLYVLTMVVARSPPTITQYVTHFRFLSCFHIMKPMGKIKDDVVSSILSDAGEVCSSQLLSFPVVVPCGRLR